MVDLQSNTTHSFRRYEVLKYSCHIRLFEADVFFEKAGQILTKRRQKKIKLRFIASTSYLGDTNIKIYLAFACCTTSKQLILGSHNPVQNYKRRF